MADSRNGELGSGRVEDTRSRNGSDRAAHADCSGLAMGERFRSQRRRSGPLEFGLAADGHNASNSDGREKDILQNEASEAYNSEGPDAATLQNEACWEAWNGASWAHAAVVVAVESKALDGCGEVASLKELTWLLLILPWPNLGSIDAFEVYCSSPST